MSRSSLIAVFLFALILAAPIIWYAAPKSEPHPLNGKCWTAHYRGFGLTGTEGVLGKRWGAVTFRPPDLGGRWRFEFTKEGYNPFKGYYPNGSLREEGECYVEVMGFRDQPYPDQHNLKWAKCYRPDGSLGSEVVNGTGTQTIWTPDGTKVWELTLRGFERVRVTMWHPNAQLQTLLNYVDGKRDGPFVSYDAQGRKVTEGAYKADERAGTWRRYGPDGSVKAVEEY